MKLNTVICADCLEVMRGMEDNSVDLILTDPPYGLPNEDFKLVKSVIVEASRVSKMQIYILDWRNPLSVKDNKFAELIWEYGWISGGRTKSNHFYPTHNTIHFCVENLFNFDTKNGTIIKRQKGFSSPRQCSYAKKSGHPYEKPIKLIEYLIEKTEEKIILDPFAGSGTTGVACQNLNRKFILIEKEQKYVDIIKKRLAQGVLNI